MFIGPLSGLVTYFQSTVRTIFLRPSASRIQSELLTVEKPFVTGNLFGNSTSNSGPTIEELRARVDKLEPAASEQLGVMAQMAQQAELLSSEL